MEVSLCDCCKSPLNHNYYMLAQWEVNDITRQALAANKQFEISKKSLCSVCYSMMMSFWELQWQEVAELLANVDKITQSKKRKIKKND